MSNSSQEKGNSTLALDTESNLPPGWKLKRVKRLKGERLDRYLYSPSGKRFRSTPHLKEYLNLNHHKLGLTIDNFPHVFSRRRSKSKMKNNHMHKNNPKASTPNIDKAVSPKILRIILGQQKILPHPSHPTEQLSQSPPQQPTQPIPHPTPQPTMIVFTQPLQPAPLVITIQPQYIIQMVGNHSLVSQNITNAADTITHDDCDDNTSDDKNANIDNNNDNINNDKDVASDAGKKNIVKNTALQILLPDINVDKDTTEKSNEVIIMNSERKLTELEELDFYYNFDYVSPHRNDYNRPPSRSLFEDEDIIEI